MVNNSANTTIPFGPSIEFPSEVLLFSVVFKFVAMIIGVLGNITVIIYTIVLNKEKTATSYLVGNLALADLLVCLTFYPIWIIEFILTILNIESDQDLFCKLSRSTIWSLLFASVATLLAITVDRYLYIVKPLKYQLIVTKRRVFLAIAGIWLTACCLLIVLLVYIERYYFRLRSYCYVNNYIYHFVINNFVGYLPLTLILILNIWILIVAEKQRKRILAETVVPATTSNGQPAITKCPPYMDFFALLKQLKHSLLLLQCWRSVSSLQLWLGRCYTTLIVVSHVNRCGT